MKDIRDISRLNWALEIYSDIVRFKTKSSRIEESKDCLQILVDFEEYEKCDDLFKILNPKKQKNGRS